jgi:putative zinc finger/helix-turn-helix YgiT family protein
MKCDVCQRKTTTKAVSVYRYSECGLDNVYLKNVQVRVCSHCKEKSPRIARITQLHATIARAVAMQPCPLRGQDVRFLRKQLGYSQKEWAAFLRTDVSTLSRWENGQQAIGVQSDSLMRLLYFRIRDEQEGVLSTERVAAASAAVGAACLLSLCVNMDNPKVYSYQSRSVRSRGTGDRVIRAALEK